MPISAHQITTMDVHMLMSIINMKLRDEFSSLTSLCNRFELDEIQVIDRLKAGGYTYFIEHNQFKDAE